MIAKTYRPALRKSALLLTGALIFNSFTGTTNADGVFRNGAGARSMALGGASVGSPDEPLEAMYSNPAGLSFVNGAQLQLGGVGGFAQGEFSDAANPNSQMHTTGGALPEAAFVYPLKSVPVTFGFSIIPEAMATVDWQFVDPNGGLNNTSYGLQRDYSQFVAIRMAGGASWKISDTLSVGVDLGGEYNRDRLIAPYIFQSFAPLRGFKTLLNLQTEGWGVNGTAGIVWRPVEKVSVGLSYRSMTYFNTEGGATGNAGTQLANIGAGSFQPDFHYQAEVDTKLPQTISGGISWQAQDWVRVIGEVDWIDWSDAFDHLNIKLKNGSNPDINSFLGASGFEDSIPLNWKNSFVYRAGLEFPFAADYTARIGYAYGENPAPSSTLTPMSAAILENTITGGLEWHHGRWTVAAAYQYDFPSTSNVGASSLAGGEFSNSSTTVDAHTFALTLGMRF